MVEVEFNYQQVGLIIQSNLSDSFETIINKYETKSKLDINNLYFLSNGKCINKNEILENIMSDSEKKNKKIVILVIPKDDPITISNNIISNDIICPICHELCKYEINNYRIKLFGCKNGHIKDNIKLNEFKETQIIDISQIKCGICKNKNKSNVYKNEFYLCYECKINLCPLCKSIHDQNHSIINYDNKNYVCIKHNESALFKYCEDCKIDMCLSCINEHKGHRVLSYEDKLVDVTNLKKRLNLLGNTINKFKMNLEETIKKFKKIIENMDIYYNINKNILNTYEKNKNKNYNLLSNLNYINSIIDNEIDNIRFNYSFGNNLNKMLYLYSEMNNENIEISMNYLPNQSSQEKLRLFGDTFIDNNLFKCKIIYGEKEYELKKYIDEIDSDNNYKYKNMLTIKLKGINNVTDLNCMFKECRQLLSLNDISNWNISNVTNISRMFNRCSLLSVLPDMSIWDTSNVVDMASIFSWCNSLKSLPDISKWNTKNVRSMNSIFNECNLLISLPNISIWDTSKVTTMSSMFYDCCSLSTLPDISQWDTSNVFNMNNMFRGCNRLLSLPDLSKWNTSKVIKKKDMFHGCNANLNIPDKLKE